MSKFISNNTLVRQLFLILAIIGGIFAIYIYGINLKNLILIITGYFLYSCLGIVMTFHRQLTHQSYKTYSILNNIFSFLGCMANTGSSISWVATHIKHHLHSDKLGDPHSPWISKWKIFLVDYPIDSKIKWRMRTLITNPYHQFLHRYYNLLLMFYSFTLFMIGGWQLMIFLHWIPVVLVSLMSNIVNYLGHKDNWYGSYKNFKLSDHSTNSWILAIPSWGETWHNNHHRYPRNYTTCYKWYELDISGILIKLIKI
jgi:stearoyl-CoA desaturase (delta-9 desaturase)